MSALSADINNLLIGAGSLLSVHPNRRSRRKKLYNPAPSAAEALFRDSERLGRDMKKAVKKVLHAQE